MPRRDENPEQPGRSPDQTDGIAEEKLEAERGGPLPDREALSLLGADVAIPLDPSIAADVLSGEPEPTVEDSPTQEVDAIEEPED
jgi:hypothetical protein